MMTTNKIKTLDDITLDEYLENEYLPKYVIIDSMKKESTRSNNYPVWYGIYCRNEVRCIAQGIPSEAGAYVYGWTLSPKQHQEAIITILNWEYYNWDCMRGRTIENLEIIPKVILVNN